MSNISHYLFGKLQFNHKDKPTTTSVGLKTADNTIANLMALYDYEVVYIPAGYEHRPDLISDLFYRTPEYWWLIMLFNNVIDPFEDFNVGDRVLLPKL